MEKLRWPTLFCNSLEVDAEGAIIGYRLRQNDGKRHVVKALQSLNFEVIAMGDSYNDISMLQTAQQGILFRPPDNVVAEYPQFPVTRDYAELKEALVPLLGAAS